MSEIVETAFEYGSCVRCGWDVEREPDGEWHGHLGGDCRSGDDLAEEGVHVVQEIYTGTRLSKLVKTEMTTVRLTGPNGEIVSVQVLPAGVNWQEVFASPMKVSMLEVLREPSHYHAELTPDEETEYLANNPDPARRTPRIVAANTVHKILFHLGGLSAVIPRGSPLRDRADDETEHIAELAEAIGAESVTWPRS